jgi:glycosyltransferase involved in cell wall biosynthesis
MTLHIGIITPHTRVSGGTKVLFTLAHLLHAKGIKTTVITKVVSDISWLSFVPEFEIKKVDSISKYTIPPDCTHIVNYLDNDTFGPMPDIPSILYLQGFGVHQYEKECINLMYPYSAVVATSKWLADIARNQFKHERVYTIPPGIDAQFTPQKRMQYLDNLDLTPYWHWQQKAQKHEIKNTDKMHTVGCLFHHAPSKNLSEFLVAMRRLHIRTKGNVRAIFLSAKAVHKKFFEKANYPYYIYVDPPQDKLQRIYYLSTVWVAPSRVEGFGLCPLEAMACGTPTVITPSFGLDEYLVHKQNCLLTSVDTERSNMAVLIENLLNNKELQTTLIHNGVKLAKRFTWDKFINSFLKVFEEVK